MIADYADEKEESDTIFSYRTSDAVSAWCRLRFFGLPQHRANSFHSPHSHSTRSARFGVRRLRANIRHLSLHSHFAFMRSSKKAMNVRFARSAFKRLRAFLPFMHSFSTFAQFGKFFAFSILDAFSYLFSIRAFGSAVLLLAFGIWRYGLVLVRVIATRSAFSFAAFAIRALFIRVRHFTAFLGIRRFQRISHSAVAFGGLAHSCHSALLSVL
jgi:hypothetical protein